MSDKYSARKQTALFVQQELQQPDFVNLLQWFLYKQRHPDTDIGHISVDILPTFHEKIKLYPSAVATFYASSGISGIGNMHHEFICATANWRKNSSHYDWIFINSDPSAEGMCGLDIARVRQFFSIKSAGVTYLVNSYNGTLILLMNQMRILACGLLNQISIQMVHVPWMLFI